MHIEAGPARLKVIDWEPKGHLVRFYFGSPRLKDWYGDDWDDKPYEHNAGPVYPEFVKYTIDLAFPFDWVIRQPNDQWCNSPYTKNAFKSGKVAVLLAHPYDDTKGVTFYMGETYARFAKKIRGMGIVPIQEHYWAVKG